eukprot:scaffold6883_cov91-Phaeocystis_antarctica.AAC.6
MRCPSRPRARLSASSATLRCARFRPLPSFVFQCIRLLAARALNLSPHDARRATDADPASGPGINYAFEAFKAFETGILPGILGFLESSDSSDNHCPSRADLATVTPQPHPDAVACELLCVFARPAAPSRPALRRPPRRTRPSHQSPQARARALCVCPLCPPPCARSGPAPRTRRSTASTRDRASSAEIIATWPYAPAGGMARKTTHERYLGRRRSSQSPGQRHWPCSDRGDRSGAGLKSGALMRGDH